MPLAKSIVKEPYKVTVVGTVRPKQWDIPVELRNDLTRITRTALL